MDEFGVMVDQDTETTENFSCDLLRKPESTSPLTISPIYSGDRSEVVSCEDRCILLIAQVVH